MEYKLNIPWRPYQRTTILNIIGAEQGTIHVIKSPRQCGKTTMVEALLLQASINNRDAVSLFVEPTVRQCKKVFRELRKSVESLPICKGSSESTMDINFTNGSQIVFLSAESDIAALQGFTVKNGGLLVIDESAFIQDDVFQALFPTTDVHKAKTILTSTPRFRYGLFYDYFVEGLNKGTVISHDWAGETILTPERLDFYRKKLPENVFRNYYLGEFTDFGSGVFGDISECVNNNPTPTSLPKNMFDKSFVSCVFGIDWATGSGGDETSITIFNNLKEMIHIESFNDLDETQTIERIVELAKQYKPTKIQVELNSIGKIFYGLLKKKLTESHINTQVIGFNTSNESKNKIVNKFQVAIQTREVTILQNEKLIYQLGIFESKPTSTGKVTYAASKNQNDDLVMSTLIAFDCLSTGSYSII